MIKKAFISIVFLVVLVGVGLFFYLDSIVKSGIEVVGTRALGTGVTVESVALSPLNGAGSISGLRVNNPEGFDQPYIFEMADVSVNIDVASVMSDVVIVESVTLTEPAITYETRVVSDNLRTLLNNLPESGASAGPDEAPAGGGKRLIIRELLLDRPQLNLSAVSMSAPIALPDIRLENIGEEGNAATAAQVLRVVLTAVNRAIVQAELPNMDMLREEVEGRIEEGVEQLQESVDDTVEDLGNRLRNVLNPN